jgi:hypothetical protein
MSKLILITIGFVIGMITTVGIYFYMLPTQTEIWRSNSELSGDGGLTIPAGTTLKLNRYMPEGFVNLTLSINVEGADLESFDVETLDVRNLNSPVWISTATNQTLEESDAKNARIN